ncbi:carbohydrate ABC transporter permease [Deinococcus peraridilitoris]|uniref:Permease component of ABC-type sugar transporter n=1 Tax=Deinococcus peraridilitoris (strain DSM 19664 / LMG 22246 / CIP 109416 / KR-200) TaxID=937777 RepID=K9ZYS0_DEIPD|nr:sugar ABC transporter permease [Deinococcus peraridilitoris]AFZ66349.1 permease component of ABC-type sugar transporter [Deinococcus peraridilitoris DSM 19664]
MSIAAPHRTPRGRARSLLALNESNPLIPYLFLFPHAILFFVFVLYPVGFGLWVSMHQYDPLNTTQPFVGLQYYRNLFDPASPQYEFFWKTLLNTCLFVVISVPALVGASLALALQLHRPIFGRAFFRTLFFAPGILSVPVIGVLWRWVFNNTGGLVNNVRAEGFGLDPINWLTTEGLAWIPIVIATIWWTVGFNMTLYLAALSGISQSYYEAAEIDGAGPWAKFRFITLPLLQPTTLFVAVTTVLTSFQLFGQSLLITGGGPLRNTQSVIQYITEEAFTNNQFASATAMSFAFGLLMLVFTAFQFKLMAKDLTQSREDR